VDDMDRTGRWVWTCMTVLLKRGMKKAFLRESVNL
jgi:hypothetical protein